MAGTKPQRELIFFIVRDGFQKNIPVAERFSSTRQGKRLQVAGPAWYNLFLAVTMREAGLKEIITESIRDLRKFPFVMARSIAEA